MLGIVAIGVVRESRKFQGIHVYIGRMGALLGHLCDSTAFLFCLAMDNVVLKILPKYIPSSSVLTFKTFKSEIIHYVIASLRNNNP